MAGDFSTEVLSAEECTNCLASTKVGRVAVSTGALPAVYSVVYVLSGDRVVFRVPAQSRLLRALDQAVVAFSIDRFDDDARGGWSVLVQGVAEQVTDPAVIAELRALPLPSWSNEPSADRFVQISTDHLSGTRVARAS